MEGVKEIVTRSKNHVFTEDQQSVLRRAYGENKRPDLVQRLKLAEELNVTEEQVKVWFQNRRNLNVILKSETANLSENDSGARERCRLSNVQRRTLEQSYEENTRPDLTNRQKLAEQLGVTETQIRVWFQNKRSGSHVSRDRKDDQIVVVSLVKPKRHTYSDQQRGVLEKFYAENAHPDFMTRQVLAEGFGLTGTQVRFWFQNKRRIQRKSGSTVTNLNQSVSTGTANISGSVNITIKPDKDTNMGNIIDASKVYSKQQQNTRYRFSEDQLQCLYAEFQKCDFSDIVRRSVISCSLGIPEQSVKIWFQNMRRTLKIRNVTFQEFLNSKNVRENHTGITSTEVMREREETNQKVLIQGELVGSYVAESEAVGGILEALKEGKIDYDYSFGFHPDGHPDVLYDCCIRPQEQQRGEVSRGNVRDVSELNPQVSKDLNSTGSTVKSESLPEFNPQEPEPVSNVEI